MTNTKHTPGPWMHLGRDGKPQTEPWNGWAIKGPDGKGIAACASSVKRLDEEKFANARLIASAPDLLMALRNITECAEAGDDGVNMDLWIMQARAAIAKATSG